MNQEAVGKSGTSSGWPSFREPSFDAKRMMRNTTNTFCKAKQVKGTDRWRCAGWSRVIQTLSCLQGTAGDLGFNLLPNITPGGACRLVGKRRAGLRVRWGIPAGP